jgi:hypothetical protein
LKSVKWNFHAFRSSAWMQVGAAIGASPMATIAHLEKDEETSRKIHGRLELAFKPVIRSAPKHPVTR